MMWTAWGEKGAFASLQELYINNANLSGRLQMWGKDDSMQQLQHLELVDNLLTGVDT